MALVHRVRTVWTGVAGTPAYTNMYVQSGSVSAAAAQAAVATFINSCCAYVIPAVTATTEGDVALVDTATDQIVGVTSVGSTVKVGTAVGAPLPAANQVLVRWLTGTFIGGRQVRGRTFIPYLSAGSNSNGQVIAATITGISNAASAYVTGLTGNAVVYSPANGVPVPITAWNVWNQFAVMRSRRD